MKTLNNLDEANFDSIEIGQVRIEDANPTTAWTLTLPPNDGEPDQVLVTDGNGVTRWDTFLDPLGTVTSVGFTAPTEQFTITNSPITTAGDISLTLNAPTGTGKIVLDTSPTLNTPLFSGGFEMVFGGNANLVNSTLFFGNKDDSNFTLLKDGNGFALKGFNSGVLRLQDGGDMLTLTGGVTPKVTMHKETFIENDLNAENVKVGTTNTTTISSGATADWTLTLPIDGGVSNHVLSTNGVGITSWSTVSSLLSTTGTGSTFVLDTNPTIISPTFNGVSTATERFEITSTSDTLRLYRTGGGDIMYFGTSLGANTTAKLLFSGLTNDTSNYVQLGYFGGIGGTRFYANADIELDRLSGVPGVIKLPSASNFTSLTSQANTDWTMSLPQNGGTAGHVLSTDGSGVTSWVAQTGGGAGSGTVTSVGYGVGTGLTLTGTASPITVNGTFTISLDNPTGTGNVVMSTSPTITNPTLNDSSLYLRNDTNHGVEYNVGVNGARLFGFTGGRLDYTDSGGGTSMFWNSSGITLPDTQDLTLTEGVFTTSITCGATSNWTLKLPGDDGTSGQILTTNGSGVTSWQTPVGGGSSTGTGAVVLQNAPSLTGQWNYNDSIKISRSTAGYMLEMYNNVGDPLYNLAALGHSPANGLAAEIQWHGTTDSDTNYLGLKFFGKSGYQRFFPEGKIETQATLRDNPTFVAKNTAAGSGNEIQCIQAEAPNMSTGSRLVMKIGQSLGGAGDRAQFEYQHFATDHPENYAQMGLGGSGTRAYLRIFNNVNKVSVFNQSVRAVARCETFFTNATQSIPASTDTVVSNFVFESGTGSDLLSHSSGVVTNNLGYTVSVTFTFQAFYTQSIFGSFKYWLRHSSLSLARYGYVDRGDSSDCANGSHTFVLNAGESVSLVVNKGGGNSIFLHGGGNNTPEICRLSYVINN